MKCGKVTRVPIHSSIKIGGSSVGVCKKECVRGMTVCLEHANKDALKMLIDNLYRELDEANEALRLAGDKKSKR